MLALEFSELNSSFQGLKFVWCWGMAPLREMVKKMTGSGTTWIELDSVENGYKLCVLGDLDGWIGDRMRVSITGAFAVQ